MCFSSEASFIVGAGLSVIGVLTLRKTTHWRERFLASVPLIFATQQFVEGLLWLALQNGEMPLAQYWLTQLYGSYAGIVWPAFIPISIMLIENNKVRKSFMAIILLIGLATVYSTINILLTGGFTAQVINSSIHYDYLQPINTYATKWSYLVAISGAFFLSSQVMIWWIGVAYILSFVVSYYLYDITYISVWCFFAAIISVLIYFYCKEKQVKADDTDRYSE